MDYVLVLVVFIYITVINVTLIQERTFYINQATDLLKKSELDFKNNRTDEKTVLKTRDELRRLYRLQHFKPDLPIVETVENMDLYVGDKDALLAIVAELKNHIDIIDKESK
jgi:hypothetical protein